LGIDARIATQSGPMLVVAGKINPNFDQASDSLKLRSGVCALTPQEVVFAVSEVPVSFHAFARLFRDGIGCRDALYLDGTLSRVWTRADGYAGASPIVAKPYAGMLAVFEQAAPVP
ncbi:MAG TPA: phosphodiester glycosidase family protein, partial [Dokdonella sp.]